MTSTTARATTITAEPHLPTIRLVRVFRAWVDPDLFARWVGPTSIGTTVEEWDATTGGRWRYSAHRDGERVAGFFGSFHEVREPSRLVQTFTWDGDPDGVSLETMTFTDLPGGRCRIDALSVFPSVEARDAMVRSGMETGVQEGYAALDRLLAEGAA